MRDLLRAWTTTMAWLAAVWALVFGSWHVVWAFGGTVALGAGGVRTPWFVAYHLAVAVACAVGVWLGIRVAHPPRDVARAHRLRVLAAVVGALLLVRGCVGLAQLAWWLLVDRSHLDVSSVWELYLLEGGLLYLAAAGIGDGGRRRAPVRERHPQPARRGSG